MRSGGFGRNGQSGLLLPARFRRGAVVEQRPSIGCGPAFFAGGRGKVVLAVPMQGADGSTAFVDLCGNSITVNGNAQLDTGVAGPFAGTSSGLFDNNGDFLSIPHSPSLNLVGVLWTIQVWIYLNGYSSDKDVLLEKDGVSGSSYNQYFLGVLSTGVLRGAIGTGDSQLSVQAFDGSTVIPLHAWHLVEMGFDGTKVYGFVHGHLEWATNKTATMTDGGRAVLIGYDTGQPSAQHYNGNMAYAWITKGACLHTASYTPPTSPPTL
jgi:hypothetical protein